MKTTTLFSFFVFTLLSAFLALPVLAASPDGSGPWADSVVGLSQGLMKNGGAVPPTRSDASQALGVAEETIAEGTFFSLGFGGSITLQFDNPVVADVVVVESTNPGYPSERARVEVSSDNSSWTTLGEVNQSGQVSQGESSVCVRYVRVTDISNSADFVDDTADAYDVDGVRITEGSSCDDEQPTPTPIETITPTPTSQPGPTPTPGNNDGDKKNDQPQQCNASKPGTPTITSIQRTSGSTVQLSWSAASDATTYAISYGTSAGNYQYGVPSTGNVTSYTIGGLDPNATYYFVVRAIHDCTPGDNSGERSTGGGSVLGASTGQVLGASTDVLAATGSSNSWVAYITAMVAAVVSGVVYFRRTTHGA